MEPCTPRPVGSFMMLSNAALALAAVRAASRGLRIHALVYTLAALASAAHHRCRESDRTRTRADELLALGVLGCNVHSLLSRRSRHTGLAVATAALSVALYLEGGRSPGAYETLHPWWHVVAGLGTWILFEGMG